MNSEFVKCVEANDLDAVTKLLESGVIKDIGADCDWVLRFSIMNENWNMVLKLLEYGANVHANNDYALRFSAKNGRLDIMTALLKLGANVNVDEGARFYSALESSSENGHLPVVTALLEADVDVHGDDDCALRLSVASQRFEIMKVLLEYGANLHCCNKAILKGLQQNFSEQIADIVLPYCDANDYEYFPQDYIRARIIPTKGANTKIWYGNTKS